MIVPNLYASPRVKEMDRLLTEFQTAAEAAASAPKDSTEAVFHAHERDLVRGRIIRLVHGWSH